MDIRKIDVPAGIKYISDWEGFELPDFPHIMDKQITGCGFTEWCITGDFNMILASPRIILLENKEEQHPGEVFYARNDLDAILNVDKDLHTIKKSEKEIKKIIEENDIDIKNKTALLRYQIRQYIDKCLATNKPIKIIVTYDSYRIVYDAIKESNYPEIFDTFYTVIDEFQSIFTDSKFKSDTELEFLSVLKGVKKLCFVSATPMMEEYLDLLDEFRDLPFYILDWASQDPSRIVKPQLEIHPCQKMLDAADKIIQSYKDGCFEKAVIKDSTGNLIEIESRELVIYVNSVKNICDIIKKAGLTIEETNVLCSGSFDNNSKIRKAFGLKRGEPGGIGKVPLKHEPRKMFTLCTRTVYLGADFYSDNARSVILSDANIDCLAVDITLDLPQILGRQRLDCNPWKNRAELYIKYLCKKNIKSQEEFDKYLKTKILKTDNLLKAYNTVDSSIKHDLADNYQKVAKTFSYKDDYVAVNTHGGSDLLPVFNRLAMLSEKRSFDIQQIDYKDRFSVFSQIQKKGYSIDPETEQVRLFLEKFRLLPYFTDKMSLLCNTELSDKVINLILNQIPVEYGKYFLTMSRSKIKALNYQKSKLEKEYISITTSPIDDGVKREKFLELFKVGDRKPLSEIKDTIREIYNSLEIKDKLPKATDLEEFFKVKKIKISNSGGGRDHGFEILGIKE